MVWPQSRGDPADLLTEKLATVTQSIHLPIVFPYPPHKASARYISHAEPEMLTLGQMVGKVIKSSAFQTCCAPDYALQLPLSGRLSTVHQGNMEVRDNTFHQIQQALGVARIPSMKHQHLGLG
ncbi:hypothetical protein FQN60_004922 [Etheostoma spectabile]|uniref:Uncharacterized protein n=1 Tax=Etheostoma spectabile TaxID=54343 RepID=A0A5J5DLI6_9PERO|nr:hypothetical protein FQN60_004922 [Etheostoma spectabile]